MSHKYCWQS